MDVLLTRPLGQAPLHRSHLALALALAVARNLPVSKTTKTFLSKVSLLSLRADPVKAETRKIAMGT